MPFYKKPKGVPKEFFPAEGFSGLDRAALTPFQREAVARLGMTIQLEQEAFLSNNPKIRTILQTYFSQLVNNRSQRENLKEAAAEIILLCHNIDQEIDQHPEFAPCDRSGCKHVFTYEDEHLQSDLSDIYTKHYPPQLWNLSSSILPTPNTLSSSFISFLTSVTTLPTPEPVPIPEPTKSELMLQMVSNVVDKAIYGGVTERALLYDTAYVELMQAVETAMEIPVIEIKVDIVDLFFCSYRMFETIIIDKERIAAEIAWEKRMRKKLKRTLRRSYNFKGYETPPTPKSEVSSHESYKVPPQRPCICHPQFYYNRYPKDRFGIYLPRPVTFCKQSVTAQPTIPGEDQDNNDTS